MGVYVTSANSYVENRKIHCSCMISVDPKPMQLQPWCNSMQKDMPRNNITLYFNSFGVAVGCNVFIQSKSCELDNVHPGSNTS